MMNPTRQSSRGPTWPRVGRLAAAVLAAWAAAAGCASNQPFTLRVLTYNIHHGEGMDGRIDLERIAAVIRDCDADLVALQEVDRGVQRSGQLDQPATLAALTGMQAIFYKNIDHQGGEYGNAVLSRLPVEHHENHDLPKSLPNEQRGLLEVHLRIDQTPLIFFATHLDYRADDGERMSSVAALRQRVERNPDVPIIVAGDLNALPDSRVIRSTTEFLHDARDADDEHDFTFPADRPDRRIDYVLFSDARRMRCLEHRVLPESVASDHRPVLAVIQIER